MRHSPPTWPRDEVAALVAELVRRPSPSGKEAAVAAYIAAWLRDAGIAADLVDTAPGRPNVTAEVSRGTSGRSLLFFGHTDTALPTEGWLTDPYAPQHRDGRLVGLGAQ
ncbi:MAG: hypothetical protein HY660_13510, partial [Armatimonadetes bacterium]|nr:hypothetical protein [Armatimonadota bacterium]